MLSIMNNFAAINAIRQFGINTKNKSKSTEKLSSGFSINRAADDAAGLSISEKMRNQIRNLNQATKNVEDGISVCQTADGALSEIASIFHRIEELSVHAANDVLIQEDREACDDELQELLKEIDKVGHDTKFNGIPLFQGQDVEIGPEGTTFSDIELKDLQLGISYGDVNLYNQSPFVPDDSANVLNIGVSTTAESGKAGMNWNLLYGNGGTSYPSVRFTVTEKSTGKKYVETVDLNGLQSILRNRGYKYIQDTNTYRQQFRYISQNFGDTVQLDVSKNVSMTDTDSKKSYDIYYDINLTSFSAGYDLEYDFMYNCDTAFNNDDYCEGYYIDGQRVNKTSVYSNDIPESFTICNLDNALSFSEKIEFDQTNKPDLISFGRYNAVDKWSYYDNLSDNIGQNLINTDLAFSVIWHEDNVNDVFQDILILKNRHHIYQGIVETKTDNNLAGLTPKYNEARLTAHRELKDFYIQSGANEGEDMMLEFDEVNCSTLGIKGVSCLTRKDAERCMTSVQNALLKLNNHRSRIGAKQNRLEYTLAANKNYSENLTSAESLIRDTDMSNEMVNYSKHNILEQVSQSMIAQANQQRSSILSLIQG